MQGRVLVIAGSDSGGGAGIQADLKTVMALGGYGMTAITALTAQDTLGVHGILPVPPDFVVRQAETALADIGADAVKIGMLGGAPVVEAVAEVLRLRASGIPVVLDPVMVAKGGAALVGDDAVAAMKRSLLPLVAVITPNRPEAEALTGRPIADEAAAAHAAETLLTLGVPAVLLKGGHAEDDTVVDLLATSAGVERIAMPRLRTPHTHGTGCTLASAVATGLAQGMALSDSVRRARAYVQRAIARAPGLGRGHGPLNHAVTLDPARLDTLAQPGSGPG